MTLLWLFLTALFTGLGTCAAKRLLAPTPSNKVKIEREYTKEVQRRVDADGTTHEYIRETVKNVAYLPDDHMVPYVIQEPDQRRLPQ